jgi:hypothetical protein
MISRSYAENSIKLNAKWRSVALGVALGQNGTPRKARKYKDF